MWDLEKNQEWFLDDGHCCVWQHKNSISYSIELSTMGFSKEENEFLAKKLSNFINEIVKVIRCKSGHFF